jgi:hypothetical protein
MAPKHHPAPLSGGDRKKALKKELSKSRAKGPQRGLHNVTGMLSVADVEKHD